MHRVWKYISVITLLCVLACSRTSTPTGTGGMEPPVRLRSEGEFIRGADVSGLPQIETHNGVFRDGGVPRDLLRILRDHGMNTVRLRTWHTPSGGWCGEEETLSMARRAYGLGFDLLLDFHYSDWWADPGSQTVPAAWEGLSGTDLEDAIRSYSAGVVKNLCDQGTPPAIVQIGNEITYGFLWDEGRIDGGSDSTDWNRFADLLRAAADGVIAGMGEDSSAKIMIHLSSGGDNVWSVRFLDEILARGVPFDMIGLSYYYHWQGPMNGLRDNLYDLANRYGRDVVVVETAYPWTLDWFDSEHNLVGLPEHLAPGYEASPEGQATFLSDLITLTESVPNGRGLGVVYWAPEWIPTPTLGSPWENMTLFDPDGELLPSVDSFLPVEAR